LAGTLFQLLRGFVPRYGISESASYIPSNLFQTFLRQTALIGSAHQLLTGLRTGIFKPFGDFSSGVS